MTERTHINVLAGLDLTDMDGELIRYAGILEQWLPHARITFLHNIKVTELSREMLEPAMLQNITAGIEKRFRKLVAEMRSPAPAYDIIITMKEFSELAFMEVTKQQKTDLVLLGNKQLLEGSGALNQKLARMLPAAVLLIPENVKHPPSHIIQAVDFSRYTPPVLRWGHIISSATQPLRLSPVYVTKMSYHFFPIFSDEEIEEALQKEAAERTRKWKEQYPLEPPLQVVHAHDRSIANTLVQLSGINHADMIILGVKGASSLTNLFMGSVANEMLQRNEVPGLLFVKP